MSMSTHDFCIWLRQLLDTAEAQALTRAETAAIRQQLSDVFLHDIDPAMGDAAHQATLNRIHRGVSTED
jgi:hypothetical protein